MNQMMIRAWDGQKLQQVGQIDFAIDQGPSYWIETVDGVHLNIHCNHLMLFTGLRDSKGERIFEGDILMIGQESSSVDYVGSSFRVMRKQIIRDETRVSYVTLDVLNISTALVIGNIYQNPELADAEVRI